MGKIEVRPAVPSDIDWIMEQLSSFSSFYGTKQSLFGTGEYQRDFMLSCMKYHLLLVANEIGVGLVGLISGLIMPHTYNPNILCLVETFWWVDEKHRGGRAGLMLLDAFTEYGKKNVDWISFCLEHNSPVNERSLLKRGFRLQERNYLMEVG